MYIIIDNYDSFTYNLAQAIEEQGITVEVFRNDQITPAEVMQRNPRGIIISPGPGRPEKAGISLPLIRYTLGQIPLLGICLGHQAIAVALGGTVQQASELVHGKDSSIRHDHTVLFSGIPNPFRAGRYHSLIVDEKTLPSCFEVTARTVEGGIMAIQHKNYPLFGLQFHPESILSPCGVAILKNFIQMENSYVAA